MIWRPAAPPSLHGSDEHSPSGGGRVLGCRRSVMDSGERQSMAELHLTTLRGCELVIGRYPRFRYDASGGGGPVTVGPREAAGWEPLAFDPSTLEIPPLSGRTTRLLGLPLPPGLAIAIEPQQLQGRWHPGSGAVELQFRSRFLFTVGSLYRAPDLIVACQLTTAQVQGRRHRASGRPLSAEGVLRLVGVATVVPTGDVWLDRFLGLPEQALAVLNGRFCQAPP